MGVKFKSPLPRHSPSSPVLCRPWLTAPATGAASSEHSGDGPCSPPLLLPRAHSSPLASYADPAGGKRLVSENLPCLVEGGSISSLLGRSQAARLQHPQLRPLGGMTTCFPFPAVRSRCSSRVWDTGAPAQRFANRSHRSQPFVYAAHVRRNRIFTGRERPVRRAVPARDRHLVRQAGAQTVGLVTTSYTPLNPRARAVTCEPLVP